MTSQLTPVILVVDGHWLLGSLATGGQRVCDILVNPDTDYLKLLNVQVFRSEPRRRVAELPEAVVPKNRLGLLLILSEKLEVSTTKRLHAVVEKKQQRSHLVAAGLTVEGLIHLPRRGHDSLYTLSTTLGHFFPVTQATIAGPRFEPMSAKVALVNKEFVSSFCCCGIGATGAPSAHESPESPAERHSSEDVASPF